MSWSRLGDLLLEANLIDEVQLKIALEEQKRLGTKFGSTLIALHFIDEDVLTAFLSKQLDMPCLSLVNIEIPRSVLGLVPREMAVRLGILPVKAEGRKLSTAICDPVDMEAIEEVERHTGMQVTPMVAPQSSIQHALARFYPDPTGSPDDARETVASAFPELIREINEMDLFAPHFRKMNDKLDLIALELAEIRAFLARKGD
jgi:type IV pilus assembly protein PilB